METARVIGMLLLGALAAGAPRAAAASIDVTQHGARGDGQTVNTRAINAAIAACVQAGGGTVRVPPGVFLSGTIELRSHVELRLEPGALIKGSPRIEDYRPDPAGEVMETSYLGLVFAQNAADVSITGGGAIDGNGTVFMDLERPHVAQDFATFVTRQKDDFMHPRFGTKDGPVLPKTRPGDLIVLSGCRGVRLVGVSLLDTPTWTLRIANGDDVLIHGITIRTNLLVPNSDGIHCTSSRNVRVSDALIEAGDDAIAITGFGGQQGIAENVTVTNCVLKSRSAGVRVGYGEDSIRNCVFQNLVIKESNRGLGVFVRDQGSVENVLFENLIIDTRLHTGHWWGKGEPIHVSALPRTEGTQPGRVRNVRFKNVVASSETGIVVWGSDPGQIQDLELDDIQLTVRPGPLSRSYGGNIDVRPAASREKGVFSRDIPGLLAHNVQGLVVRDLDLRFEEGLPEFFSHGIECEGVSELLIDGFSGRQAHDIGAAIVLRRVKGVTVRNSRALPGTDIFLTHEGLEEPRLFTGNDLVEARVVFAPDEPPFTGSGNRMP
jgi:hypothetical protein